MQALGPDDSDYQLVTSADHKHLYAANGGSDTISVFDINADGSLTALAAIALPQRRQVAGEHGLRRLVPARHQPGRRSRSRSHRRQRQLRDARHRRRRLALRGHRRHPRSLPASAPPPSSRRPTAPSPSPTSSTSPAARPPVCVRSPSAPPARSPRRPATSTRSRADDGGPDGGIQNDQLVLGLGLNPVNKVLYVNYVIRSEISAWSYDSTGALTVHGSAKVSGGAPCWNRVSKDGKFLYVTDTALDQVSVLSISTDGLTLQEIQIFTLSNPGPTLVDAGGNTGHTASESYRRGDLARREVPLRRQRASLERHDVHRGQHAPRPRHRPDHRQAQRDRDPRSRSTPRRGVPITARTRGSRPSSDRASPPARVLRS